MDPLMEPSISHPQTTSSRSATGTQRVAPGSMYLGRHREQCTGHWAQDSRFRHGNGLASPGAARRRLPRLSHVRPVGALATAGRVRAAPLGRNLVLFTCGWWGCPSLTPCGWWGCSESAPSWPAALDVPARNAVGRPLIGHLPRSRRGPRPNGTLGSWSPGARPAR